MRQSILNLISSLYSQKLLLMAITGGTEGLRTASRRNHIITRRLKHSMVPIERAAMHDLISVSGREMTAVIGLILEVGLQSCGRRWTCGCALIR